MQILPTLHPYVSDVGSQLTRAGCVELFPPCCCTSCLKPVYVFRENMEYNLRICLILTKRSTETVKISSIRPELNWNRFAIHFVFYAANALMILMKIYNANLFSSFLSLLQYRMLKSKY